jgi:5-methylcytosine-specific restriction endonuclease McrBC GTP-binding regulatory subunit McrB
VEEGFEGDPAGRIRTFAWQLDQFARSIRVGDIVVVPEGSSGPLLFGEVTGEYEYRDPPPLENWRHVREVQWLGRKDRASLSNKTRRSLGAATTIFFPDGQDELRALLFGTPTEEEPASDLTMDWLETETLWNRADLEELVRTLEISSPQIVLAGPPGTGKTWVAERVARYLTRGAPGATRLVQFHPSYSYEDFIEGLRPQVEDGAVTFERVDGVVLEMTSEIEDETRLHVLVVDEMNRANLPRVFGELMYLFEYRDKPVDLRYTRSFSLPSNLRFIGTMNTADRSIRSIDVALRRRFDIFECQPDAEILRRYYKTHTSEIENLVEGFESLNAALEEQLDRHHTIGHSFFMASPMTRQELLRVWTRKVAPLIEEYFFDQPDVAGDFTLERFWS